MGLTKQPPLIATQQTPLDILGGNYALFRDYCETYFQNQVSEGLEKKIAKDFSPSNRKRITEMMKVLRTYGFVPVGINKKGNIEFSYVLKSALQIEFEKGLSEYQGKSRQELRELAAKGYVAMRDQENIYPDGNSYELAKDSAY